MQKSLKTEHFLWQLLNIEKDTTKFNDDLEDEKRSHEEFKHEQDNCEREATKKKKEQAGYMKKITQLEKHIAEKKNKLDKDVSLFVCQ